MPSGIDYHVQNPRIEVKLRNAAATVKFCYDKVEAQTQAKNPVTNMPWAYAQNESKCLDVSGDGNIQLPLPSLPDPGDVNLSARNVCKNLCPKVPSGTKPTLPTLPSGPRPSDPFGRAVYDEAVSKYNEAKKSLDDWNKAVDVHNQCVNRCNDKNPLPPPIPRLPEKISVRVEEVVR